MSNKKIRAEFEAWIMARIAKFRGRIPTPNLNYGPSFDPVNGSYEDRAIAGSWSAWQAASAVQAAEIARLTAELAQAKKRTVTDTDLSILREHLKIGAVMGDPVTLSSNAAAPDNGAWLSSMQAVMPDGPERALPVAAAISVPDEWHKFANDCLGTAGCMVEGNTLSRMAARLLAASPKPLEAA